MLIRKTIFKEKKKFFNINFRKIPISKHIIMSRNNLFEVLFYFLFKSYLN